MRVSPRSPLPLVHPPNSPPAVQAQADQTQAEQPQPPGAAPGAGQSGEQDPSATDRPTPEQVADRVYQLLLQDLRIQRERLGKS